MVSHVDTALARALTARARLGNTQHRTRRVYTLHINLAQPLAQPSSIHNARKHTSDVPPTHKRAIYIDTRACVAKSFRVARAPSVSQSAGAPATRSPSTPTTHVAQRTSSRHGCGEVLAVGCSHLPPAQLASARATYPPRQAPLAIAFCVTSARPPHSPSRRCSRAPPLCTHQVCILHAARLEPPSPTPRLPSRFSQRPSHASKSGRTRKPPPKPPWPPERWPV